MTRAIVLFILFLSSIPTAAQIADTTRSAPYVMQEGDTLFELSARLGISVSDLEGLNSESFDLIRAGTEYRIPIDKVSTSYTVKQGDTLFDLSRRFGVSVSDISQANDMSGSNLQAGQQLEIPGQGVRPSIELEELNPNSMVNAIAVGIPNKFIGRVMSNGKKYDPARFSISHPNFPVGSVVWIKKSEAERGTFAEVTERSFSEVPQLVDLSDAVADFIGLETRSWAQVEIRLIHEADN